MNILVTGAKGQLGTCVDKSVKNPDDNYFYTDIDELDISSYDGVKQYVVNHNIDCIINCAAYTNVDKAEEPEEFDLVKKINCDAVKNLAFVAKEHAVLLIHISTDYVFGGNMNNTPCDESQKPNPTGVYGQTKLMGEDENKVSGCDYLIFRTAWLYSEYGRNFVKTMMQLMTDKKLLKVVFDQCGTPTYAQDLADAIVYIIGERKFKDKKGIYNYSNQGVCSWYDFSQMIQTLSGLNDCEIFPCHSSEFPSKVKRPAYSVLDKTKFVETFGIKVPYWVDSLSVCIDNIQNSQN